MSAIVFTLSGCLSTGGGEKEIIRVKVIDKSTYGYTANSTTTKATEKAKPAPTKAQLANIKWISPVNAPLQDSFTIKTKKSIFASKNGMNIVAINDGKVVYSSGNLKSFGNMIIIKHAYGFYSHYMFGDTLIVKVGDSVKKGDVIATTSKKPFALQMKKYTTVVNPEKYITPIK